VRVEPWAREYDIAPGTSREFHFAGPDPADIEIEVAPAEVTIYGWVGSFLDDTGLPVPGTPTIE